MATSKQFLTYLLEQLSDLEEITHRIYHLLSG